MSAGTAEVHARPPRGPPAGGTAAGGPDLPRQGRELVHKRPFLGPHVRARQCSALAHPAACSAPGVKAHRNLLREHRGAEERRSRHQAEHCGAHARPSKEQKITYYLKCHSAFKCLLMEGNLKETFLLSKTSNTRPRRGSRVLVHPTRVQRGLRRTRRLWFG